ncbi:MAG: hypothetical protein R3192_08845 [Woeseiaceae bacterium]|nr:hypothetical protein [Woeseiaceae bacterium]
MIKFGLHAVAVLYSGGSIAQLLKLIYNFPWQEMPFIIDWIIVVVGTIGLMTLVIQTPNVEYRGWWEKPVHFLIIAHLGVSVALHIWTIYVSNHDLYAAFPPEYSYFALAYFAFFAWRSWTVKLVSRETSEK